MNHQMVSALAKSIVPLIGEPIAKLRGEHGDRIITLEQRIGEFEKRELLLLDQIKSLQDVVGRMISVSEKIAELEQRALVPGPQGEPGKDGRDGKDGAPSLDGKDGAPGLDGKDGRDGKDGLNGKDGADGRDADMTVVADMIRATVDKAVRELPPPERGEKGDPGERGERGERGEQGLPGINGNDGIGLTNALIDRDGVLVVMLKDGSTFKVGPVVGRDGTPGVPGMQGQDGKDGKDGKDGFSLEHFDTEMLADGKTVLLKFKSGNVEEIHELFFPVLTDKGVFHDGEMYTKGDAVTFGGSLFIAQEDTRDRPETSKSWRLAVKRGRDGKDGKPGEKGEKGAPGKDGK